MPDGVLLSIQVGKPTTYVDHGTKWRTAFYKTTVDSPVHVGRTTVDGDGQENLKFHGGPDRPVLAYCAEHYARWHDEQILTDASFGGFGENFTITGMDETSVCLGDRYAIGEVEMEVSQPRQPCSKLARRWQNPALPSLVLLHARGGWYLRTIKEGTVKPGVAVKLLDRPYPNWSIKRAMDVMYEKEDDPESTRELMNLPPLSEQWRQQFEKRLSGLE